MRFRVVATIDVVAPAVALVVAVGARDRRAPATGRSSRSRSCMALTALVGFGLVGALAAAAVRPHGAHAQPLRLRRQPARLAADRVRGQQRRLADDRAPVRRDAARHLQPRVPAADEPAEPGPRAQHHGGAARCCRGRAPRPQFDSIVRNGQLVLGYPIAVGAGAAGRRRRADRRRSCSGRSGRRCHRSCACSPSPGSSRRSPTSGTGCTSRAGSPAQLLQYTLMSAAIRIVCVIGGSTWGVVGVAAGYALAPALAWPLSLWWLNRSTKLDVRSLYSGAGRILVVGSVAGLASAAASWALRDESPWWQVRRRRAGRARRRRARGPAVPARCDGDMLRPAPGRDRGATPTRAA